MVWFVKKNDIVRDGINWGSGNIEIEGILNVFVYSFKMNYKNLIFWVFIIYFMLGIVRNLRDL